jgi:hypothetical protein
MATTPIIFPEWLPPGVARYVRDHILSDPPTADAVDTLRLGNKPTAEAEDTLRRLVTDDRMRSVWRELRRHATATCPLNQRRADPGEAAWPAEEVLGSFFASVWFSTVYRWQAIPKSDVNEALDHWRRTRDQLAQAALFLERAATPAEGGLYMDTFLLHQADLIKNTTAHAGNAKAAANFCHLVAALISRHAAQSVLVVDRDFGTSRERGYVTALTHYTRQAFGKALCGTVATIANVALNPTIPITKKQVENWCPHNKDG